MMVMFSTYSDGDFHLLRRGVETKTDLSSGVGERTSSMLARFGVGGARQHHLHGGRTGELIASAIGQTAVKNQRNYAGRRANAHRMFGKIDINAHQLASQNGGRIAHICAA